MNKHGKIKKCFNNLLGTIFIIITFTLAGVKLNHAHMVDKAFVAINNGYTVIVDGKEIINSDALFMSTSEISEYSIKVDDDKKIVELN